MYGILKDRGTRAQQDYLDRLALSKRQARALGTDLLDMLGAIRSDKSDGQVVAAVAPDQDERLAGDHHPHQLRR
jgi:hypothetical protein